MLDFLVLLEELNKFVVDLIDPLNQDDETENSNQVAITVLLCILKGDREESHCSQQVNQVWDELSPNDLALIFFPKLFKDVLDKVT